MKTVFFFVVSISRKVRYHRFSVGILFNTTVKIFWLLNVFLLTKFLTVWIPHSRSDPSLVHPCIDLISSVLFGCGDRPGTACCPDWRPAFGEELRVGGAASGGADEKEQSSGKGMSNLDAYFYIFIQNVYCFGISVNKGFMFFFHESRFIVHF